MTQEDKLTIIEKIRAEVERLKGLYNPNDYDDAKRIETLAYVENILSDLEKEEKPTNIDFEQELYKHFGQVKDFTLGMQIGKYFYELGCHRTAEKYDEIEYKRQRAEESVPSDLEEAAGEYAEKHGFRVPYDGSDNFYDNVDVKASKEGFIAGAKWQAEQDKETIELAEHHAYLAGAVNEREKMMKEAVEGWVSSTQGDHFGCVTSMPTDLGKLYGADKCKIIIVKED